MKKEVMLVAGAGQISMAIARRTGFGKKIILGDKKLENASAIAKVMNEAGYDVEAMEMDLSSRESIRNMIARGQKYGEIGIPKFSVLHNDVLPCESNLRLFSRFFPVASVPLPFSACDKHYFFFHKFLLFIRTSVLPFLISRIAPLK